MNSRFVSTMHQVLLGVAALTVLALVAPPTGNGQGVKAAASPAAPKASLDPLALQKQLQALEKRVLELEKEAIETAEDANDSDAAAALVDQRLRDSEAAVKQLTQRMAKAEKSGGDDKPGADKADGKSDRADDDSPLTVTAPFVVVDSSGKPIMRVVEAENGFSRGVYLYNDGGNSVAHVGSFGDGSGRLYVSRPGAIPSVQLVAKPEGGALAVGNGTGFVAVLDKNVLSFIGDSKAPLAAFGTKNRTKGYLELNDGSGNKMVEAGMLNNSKGYVLANPYRASTDPHGDPSVLKGAGK